MSVQSPARAAQASPAPSISGARLLLAPITRRGGWLILVSAVVSLFAFTWPLIFAGTHAPRWLPVVLLFACVPGCIGLVSAELANHSLDVKGLAMLGILSAVGAAVRPLGAGTAGIETVFFTILLAGRVFGPGFGFVTGVTTLFASALLTGGFGVWLPYQMLAAALVGLGAGLLPHAGRRTEIWLLCLYGGVAAFVFGALMDLAFWPFALGDQTSLSYLPDAGPLTNLHRFVIYETATALGWNLGRAITTAVLLIVLGRPLLHVLRRTARRSEFSAPHAG